ncbi:MAG: hypothetical protein KC736_01315 [Candidatus Moranbacteria bacterium]|nr:hypothetical protein [Candidatus Moranbacteria bacterium]
MWEVKTRQKKKKYITHSLQYKPPKPFEDMDKASQGFVYIVNRLPEKIGDSPLFIVQLKRLTNPALYYALIDEEVAKKMQIGNSVKGGTFYHYMLHNGAHQTIVTMSQDQTHP